MNSKENTTSESSQCHRKINVIVNGNVEVAPGFYSETKAEYPLPYRELNDNCNIFDIVGRNAPELRDEILSLLLRGNDLNGILDYVYEVSFSGSGFYRKNAKQLYKALLKNSHEIEGMWS